MNVCVTCGGWGYLDSETETEDGEDDQCPDCEGTGKVDDQGFSSSYSTDTEEQEKQL